MMLTPLIVAHPLMAVWIAFAAGLAVMGGGMLAWAMCMAAGKKPAETFIITHSDGSARRAAFID